MKSFILACVAAIACAEPVIKDGNSASFPLAKDGSDTKASGTMGELYIEDGKDRYVVIYMGWET